MSATALRRVAFSAIAPQQNIVKLQRRFAGAAYAHMKVKKNNWVEQNEVLRENQFYNWRMHKGNIVGLFAMVVVFPLGYRYLYKSELETRDALAGLPPRERM